MAEGEVAYSAEHVERLLQCAVCLDRFKKPKQLPCQHTFCLNPCLEGLVNRLTRTLRCPECRAEHMVPRGGPSRFPNNLTLISFLELPPIAGERSNAAAAAPASGNPPPQNAAGATSNQPTAARGSVARNRAVDAAAMDRDGAEGGAVRGGGECTACHTEARLARCSHCERLLCEACKRAHMEMVRGDLNRLVSQVRRSLPRITEQANQVGHKGAQLQSRCESLKIEIADTIDKHIRELKDRERLLFNDVDAFLINELRVLRMHQENLEVELASMASFCDSTESSLSGSSHLTDGELVELKRQCVENMEALRSYQDGTVRSPVTRNIQLSSESQFLSTCISSYGDLMISSGNTTVQTSSAPSQARAERSTRGAGGGESTLEATADLAMSLWSSEPAFHQAPSVNRRRFSSLLRNARSAQVNAAPENTLEEDAPEPTPRPSRRRCRRQTSDTRSATGSHEGLSISRQIRNRLRRHRNLRMLPPTEENSDLSGSSPERDNALENGLSLPRRARAFQAESDSETGHAQPLSFSSRPPAQRLPLLAAPEPEGVLQPAQSSPEAVPSYLSTDNSPSMYVNTPRNKYGQKGQPVACIGERGNGESQFTWPRGVGVSPLDDLVFVSDSSNHRVQVFDNTGMFIRSFGRYGQAEGEFDCLAGITVNGLGQVIIADRYNHRVQIFDRQGHFQKSFGTEGTNDGELNYPWGVACDSMGFIYVADKENHRIQVFQANGTFVRKIGRPGNGNGQLDNPHYVAVSPDNKVYVSDSSNHRVQVFSMYGDFLFSFGISGTLRGQMKFPRGIAIDNQGFVVVADSGNNRVQVFRADGRYFSMFGGWGSDSGKFKGIEGVAILANGNVVVSDRENHRVQIF